MLRIATSRHHPDSNVRIGVVWQSFLFPKTLEGGRRLECRNVVRGNFDRRILCDVTRRLFLVVFDGEGAEAAQKTFSLRICAARTSSMKPSTTADTVVASMPVSRAICLTISSLVIV